MALVYIRKTFIEMIPDPDENCTDLPRIPSAAAASAEKRSSSAPPQLTSAPPDNVPKQLIKLASVLSVQGTASTPCTLTPRSESSTAASSEERNNTPSQNLSSDCESAADMCTGPGPWPWACATPCSLSPRSDHSTAASSEQNDLIAQGSQVSTSATSDDGGATDAGSTDWKLTMEAQAQSSEPTFEESEDFCICLSISEALPLGFDVDRTDGITLFVKSVAAGGALEQWNEQHPDRQVKNGDRVISVNSIAGSALEMLRECKRQNVLCMRIVRNAAPEQIASAVASLCIAPRGGTSNKAISQSKGRPQGGCRGMRWGSTKLQPEAIKTQASPQVCSPCFFAMKPSGTTPGGLLVNHSGSCGEVSSILRSAAHGLTFNPKAKSVQVMEGAMGSSSAINIELRRSYTPGDAQCLTNLAKSALLDAAAQSQSTYIVGYQGTPFAHFGELSFRATIARVRNDDTACWDFYQKGFCPRPSCCRWSHPEGADLMTVWVNLTL